MKEYHPHLSVCEMNNHVLCGRICFKQQHSTERPKHLCTEHQRTADLSQSTSHGRVNTPERTSFSFFNCHSTVNTIASLHQYEHHSFFLSASGGAGGVRTVITRQHELILRVAYPHADVELRGMLSEQLVALLDSLLSGYVAQLTSLRRAGQQERYVTLENEYTQKRSELLAPLREF